MSFWKGMIGVAVIVAIVFGFDGLISFGKRLQAEGSAETERARIANAPLPMVAEDVILVCGTQQASVDVSGHAYSDGREIPVHASYGVTLVTGLVNRSGKDSSLTLVSSAPVLLQPGRQYFISYRPTRNRHPTLADYGFGGSVGFSPFLQPGLLADGVLNPHIEASYWQGTKQCEQ